MNIQDKEHIVNAKAIFDDGRTDTLEQRLDRKAKNGRSRCLFFSYFKITVGNDTYEARPRLDFTDCSNNGDPTLDVEIYNGEKKLKYGTWHQTPKTQNSSGEWVYIWRFKSCRLEFKVQYTNQRVIRGCARIAAPPAVAN